MSLRTAKSIATISILATALSHAGLAAGEAEEAVKFVRGRITGIDFAGSRLTIDWFYSTDNIEHKNMTFHIPDKVEVYTLKDTIFNQMKRISVVQLLISDHVIVKYKEDRGKKRYEALTIKVLDQDAPIPP